MEPPTSMPGGDATGAGTPVHDLRRRWALARVAAARAFVPDGAADEAELFEAATAADRDAFQRRIFDHARALGEGFRRYYRITLTLPDLAAMLPAMGAPCHAGGFCRQPSAVWTSDAPPCARASAAVCSAWREATLGLVGGLSDTYYSRRTSGATGAARCVDVLHADALAPERLASIDPELAATLAALEARVARFHPALRIAWLGLADGVLHYTVDTASTPSCGGFDPRPVVAKNLANALPHLRTHDVTPRSVLPDR